jgi:spore maturation protein CgeB
MIEQTNEKVLIFSSREICYSSSNFFANQIAAAFEELGVLADICELGAEDDLEEKLNPYMGRKYRLILDFNSRLPRMILDDDSSYLDHIDAPFYDYILDHPLFHYNGLMGKVKNFHAIALDEAQKDYILKYYKNIKSCHTMPLAATESMFHGEKNPPDHVLFMGTYDSPEGVYELVKAAPDGVREMMDSVIAQRIAEPLLTMEEAFCRYLSREELELPEDKFAMILNSIYPADAYIRDYFRKAALDELLDHGIPVQLVGEGWQKYQHKNEHLIRREKPVTFSFSFEKIAREEILLNVSPIFSHGLHDRVLAGMANHTAVLTDANPYLERIFTKGEVAFYSLSNLATLSEQAGRLMEDTAYRERMKEAAYQTFTKNHTWENRARQLLEWTDACTF